MDLQRFREMVGTPPSEANRWKAQIATESALAGDPNPDVTPDFDIALRALGRADIGGGEPIRIIAAAGRVLEARMDVGASANELAVMMASDVTIQRDAAILLDRGTISQGNAVVRLDAEVKASGRFHQLPLTDVAAVALALKGGYLVSNEDKVRISVAVEQETLRELSLAGGMDQAKAIKDAAADGMSRIEAGIGMASSELGVGPSDWKQNPGALGSLSMLLHVQAPALLRIAGENPKVDPSNEAHVEMERQTIVRHGVGYIRGPRENLEHAAKAIDWLGPRVPDEVRSVVSMDGPLRNLMNEVERGAWLQRGAAVAARGAAEAISR